MSEHPDEDPSPGADLEIRHVQVTNFAGLPFYVAPMMSEEHELVALADAMTFPHIWIESALDEECKTYLAPFIKAVLESYGLVILETNVNGMHYGFGEIRPKRLERDPLASSDLAQRVAYLVHFDENSDPKRVAAWRARSDMVWLVYDGDISKLPHFLASAMTEEEIEEREQLDDIIKSLKEAGEDTSQYEEALAMPSGTNESRVVIFGGSARLKEKMEHTPLARFYYQEGSS